MPVVQVTLHLPDDLWHAVQALAPREGDPNTVILRALGDYVAGAGKRRGHLSKGGRDEPSNMQWLPKAQHQDKTRRDLRP